MTTAIETWLDRRTVFLSQARTQALAPWLVPLLLGLLSVLLGQDEGWDMRNYHLYNPYALLHGRVGFDLAPAGFQSYFNPTLDLPYYLLTNWLPPQLVAFVMGAVQGLNFLLVLGIARSVLGAQAGARQPMLLALAGLFGVAFLAELGNSMGDNLTALLMLWPLLHLLRRWDGLAQPGSAAIAVLAGAVMGMGVGLKLTNAVFAVALCLSVLCLAPGSVAGRLRLAFVFGLGVLAGIALTGGWWMFKMWQMYGNPLFPQFNNLFHSPLASEGGIMDLGHLPKSWQEALLWPFVFTRDMMRVNELPFKQAIWPVAYLLFIALAVQWLLRRRAVPADARRGSFLLLFFAIAYLVWLKLFSIYRYLVPLELLAPLVVWVLLQRFFAPVAARRLGVAVLGAIALYALPFITWGHADWAERSFSAQVPAMEQPASTIVYLVQPDPPTAWLAQFFPPEVQFIALGTGFPESALFRKKIAEAGRARSGPHYVLFSAARNPREVSLRKKQALAQWLGQTRSEEGCARLDRLLSKVRFQVQVQALPPGGAEHCEVVLQPPYQLDLEALDREAGQRWAKKMASDDGLRLDVASCRTYHAAIGATPHPFRLCRVIGPD